MTPSDTDQIELLRRRRESLAQKRHVHAARERYGQNLASKLARLSSAPLALSDFQPDTSPPYPFELPSDIREARGLVAAYVDNERATNIARCIDAEGHLGGGLIGVHANDYLGYALIQSLDVPRLVEVAEGIKDTLVFYPADGSGAVVFDYYENRNGFLPFSVILQGDRFDDLRDRCGSLA